MIEQTLQNIADAQHANGAVPTTAPEYIYFKGKWLDPFAESPEWGGALVALPFLYLQHYGDDRMVKICTADVPLCGLSPEQGQLPDTETRLG